MADGTTPSALDRTTPLEQAYRAYEQAEGQVSKALDQLVATNGFADLLATSATSVMAAARLVNGTLDRVVRVTRLAVRDDVAQLARQLARTEDKLERLLQDVQTLTAQLERLERDQATQRDQASQRGPASPGGQRGQRVEEQVPSALPSSIVSPHPPVARPKANGTARAPRRSSTPAQEPT